MVDFQITLEQAAFDGKQVKIKTKNRGTITGMFTGIDEFETDSDRLGFCVDISEYEYDVVFPDEIIEITVLPESKDVFTLREIKLAIGK